MVARLSVLALALITGAAGVSFCSGAVVYACDRARVFSIDVDAPGLPATLLLSGQPVLSIAAGRREGHFFLQESDGDIAAYDRATGEYTPTGLNLEGNSFAEGRDGYWYLNWFEPERRQNLRRFVPDDPSYAPADLDSGSHPYAGDLATDNSGQMWGAVYLAPGGPYYLVRVDKNTGAQELVGNMGSNILGLAFTKDGRLFGGAGTRFFQVNTITGVATYIGDVSLQVHDLANEAPVPEPGSLILAAVGVLAARAWKARGRRRV